MAKTSTCHIGTSGWHYDHWKGPFYPEKFPPDKMLSFYSRRFKTVEINNSFYKLPDKKTFKQWFKIVQGDFLFAVKASRYITHMKKLKDPKEGLTNFFNNVGSLKNKLGPILFQLPPRWHLNLGRLESFLDQLPKKQRCAFEFRDHSWFDENVYRTLAKHNASFCIYELAGQKSPEEVTADYVYVRLHGPESNAYEGKYSIKRLKTWAGKFKKWMQQGKDIYCYFDNDQKGFAVENALKLKQIIDS